MSFKKEPLVSTSERRSEIILLCLDLLMIVLAVVNLLWLGFDTLFGVPLIKNFLLTQFPAPSLFYDSVIYPNFLLFDLVFVAIFLSDFIGRWIYFAVKDKYHKWWFFPLIHLHELIGCLPIGGLRLLRLLRVIPCVVRMQRLGFLSFDTMPFVNQINFFRGVLVEEISDRVVVNVLEGLKNEIAQDNPVVQQIAQEVILPKKKELALWLEQHLLQWMATSYFPRSLQLENYVAHLVHESLMRSPGVERLEKLPILGGWVTNTLEQTVTQAVVQILNQVVRDLNSAKAHELIEEAVALALDSLASPHGSMSRLVKSTVLEVFDRIIREVKVQRWKEGRSL